MRIRSTLLILALGTLVLVPAQAAVAGSPCAMPDRWPTEPSTAVTTEVEMDWCAFIPTVAHVEPGATVTFSNLDPQMPHTVTGVGGGMLGWDHRTDDSLTWTAPEQPGVYPYACMLHPGMVGAIVVGDTDAVQAWVGAQEAADTATRSTMSWWAAVTVAAVAVAVMALWARRRSQTPGP